MEFNRGAHSRTEEHIPEQRGCISEPRRTQNRRTEEQNKGTEEEANAKSQLSPADPSTVPQESLLHGPAVYKYMFMFIFIIYIYIYTVREPKEGTHMS